MTLSREALLTPAAVPVEEVPIAALGGSVKVRGMTARQRSEFEKSFQTSSGKPNKRKQGQMRERMCVACCVDDDGQALFTEDDIDALGRQRADIVEPIVNVAMRLCGMTQEDVEQLEGNSDGTDEGS